MPFFTCSAVPVDNTCWKTIHINEELVGGTKPCFLKAFRFSLCVCLFLFWTALSLTNHGDQGGQPGCCLFAERPGSSARVVPPCCCGCGAGPWVGGKVSGAKERSG